MQDTKQTIVSATVKGRTIDINVSYLAGEPLIAPFTSTINIPVGISNLNPLESVVLETYIEDNIRNVPSSIIKPVDLGNGRTDYIGINNVAKDAADQWYKSNRASEVVEVNAANTASANLGIPGITPRASDTLSGMGAVPYNPNNNFNPTHPEEIARQSALATRQRLLDPKAGKTIGDTGTLVDTLSGSDLSIFFLAEIPMIQDVIDKDIPKHLWRKELMLIEVDSVLSATYSVMREVFPVRTLGRSKPKSFVRGPSTISGSLAFTIFTEDVLVRMRTQMQRSINDLEIKTKNVIENYNREISKYNSSNNSNINSISATGVDSIKQANDLTATYRMYNQVLNTGGIFMLNQLLPFHILIMGTTERGTFAKMMLKNIRVIDENQMQGVQQPNIVNRISFVAEDIFPLMAGNLMDGMAYGATASQDQNNIGGNQFSIYTGSQVMKDISSMVSNDYRLTGSR